MDARDTNRARPVKSFTLTPKAIDRLEEIAKLWEVSHSAAVVRIIMEAEVTPPPMLPRGKRAQ